VEKISKEKIEMAISQIYKNTFHTKSNKKIFFRIIIISLFLLHCNSKKEIEQFQAAITTENPESRVEQLKTFAENYPKSDSLGSVYLNILNTMYKELSLKSEAIKYFSNLLISENNEDVRYNLYFFINRIQNKDAHTAAIKTERILNQQRNKDLKIEAYRFLIQLCSLISLPDSVRRQEIKTAGNLLINSEWYDPNDFINLSDTIIQIKDTTLLDLSSRLLIKGIKVNTGENIMRIYPGEKDTSWLSDKIQQNYFHLFLKLAWNAYRQRNYTYAMNLISQASKYNDLSLNNGLILLGGIEVKNGDVKKGWNNVLKGLLIDTSAEQKFTKIENIYTDIFRQVKGTRESPGKFLKKYRDTHQLQIEKTD